MKKPVLMSLSLALFLLGCQEQAPSIEPTCQDLPKEILVTIYAGGSGSSPELKALEAQPCYSVSKVDHADRIGWFYVKMYKRPNVEPKIEH